MAKKNNKKYRTGMADRVRAAAKSLDCPEGFSRKDVMYEVDPHAGQEERSLENAFHDLRKRGEIRRIGYAKYRVATDLAPRAGVRQKIYRAMHIKGAFCAKDIRVLTDADPSYILMVIRKLRQSGHLERTGGSTRGNIFRVKQRDKFYLEFVK